MLIGIIIVIVIIIIIALFYNSLISLRNKVQEGWAQIDVQLKRRADLIPNLVETVKGYASHEKSVFEEVTQARSALTKTLDSGKLDDIANANNMLSASLGKLFAVAENYPTLKASDNFLNLQEELSNTENKVAFARQYYNDIVRQLNTKIETIPTNFVAQICKINRAEYFEIDNPSDKNPPKVNFS
jgi:LemA protein